MSLDKKKEIVNFLMSKNVLIDPELLSKLDSPEKVDNLYTFIKEGGDNVALSFNILKKSQEQAQPALTQAENSKKNQKIKEELLKRYPLEVTFNYEEVEKKRDIQDFVSYFNARYKSIRNILTQRQELSSLVSIGKLRNASQNEKVAFVGMISDKIETKNGNMMLTMEDPTGEIKVLISKNKKEVMELSKDLVLDEVIGITGKSSDKIVFADNFYLPEVPYTKEFKKEL